MIFTEARIIVMSNCYIIISRAKQRQRNAQKVCRKWKVVVLLMRPIVILPKYGQDSYFGMVYLLFYKDYHLTTKCDFLTINYDIWENS